MKMLRLFMLALLLTITTVPLAAQPDSSFSPELNTQMDALVAATEILRDLPTQAPVERAFPSRPEVIAYLSDLYNAELPDEEVDRQVRLYAALDLLPADIDLRGVYLDLLGQQVAGFYDTDTRLMNVIPIVGDNVGATLSITEEIIFVHEYTHALQDQYFDLDTLTERETAISPDASLAVISLIESDATAVMQLYTQQIAEANPFAIFAVLAEGLQSGGLALPPGIPDILGRELLFPYEAGLSFVLALYAEGGWEAINAAYANPPQTVEHILHPETYLAGEGAQEVTLPDYGPVLGADWSPVWDTRLGEFYLREFLAAHTDAATAVQAAAGWGGDRFVLYSGDPADRAESAWALRIRWDTFADQAEFADALSTYMDTRFGPSTAPGCWQNADIALCFTGGESIGSLITGAPTLALAQALAAAE